MPLSYVVPEYKKPSITNIGHVFRDLTEVYGVTPNFFDVTIPGFLQVDEMDKTSPYPLLTQLYTPVGTGCAIIGSLYKSKIGITDLNSQFLIEIQSK